MDEPDLSTWLLHWRRAAQNGSGSLGALEPDPIVVSIEDEDWVTLSATAFPHALRLDMVLDAELPDEVIPWLVRQILHWTFDHSCADTGLQFALAPDATLVAYTHLTPAPEDGAPAVMERILEAMDQAEDAWSQILVDAMLEAHLEARPPLGAPLGMAV